MENLKAKEEVVTVWTENVEVSTEWKNVTEKPVNKKRKKVNPNSFNDYTGWHKWTPTSDEWMEFELSQHQKLPFELLENEYLLVYDQWEPDTLCGQYVMKEGKLQKIGRNSIKSQVPTGPKGTKKVYMPRNDEQVWAFHLIKDRDTPIKLLTGTYGSGKTMLLVAEALELLEEKVVDNVIWIRNNVRVDDTEDMGALPGTEFEKLEPFLGPFVDHAGKEKVSTLLSKGSLIVQPLQTLRGRNLERSILLCSEAENLTKKHIQLIIGRAAEGTEVWFDADCRQRDRRAFEKSQGIETMIERFKGKPLFGYTHLTKSERSATAAMADLLDD